MNFMQKMKFNKLKKKAEKLYQSRQEKEATEANIKKEIVVLLDLAKFYEAHVKDIPQADIYSLESYRAGASLKDANAQYIVGRKFFDRARFWEEMIETMYGSDVHNKYASDAYAEAFDYLQQAESSGHPLAKRLRGLANVQGWGVPANKEEGFKLIVESINQQDAWERAPKILKEMGLSSPDFFSSIMSMKNTMDS